MKTVALGALGGTPAAGAPANSERLLKGWEHYRGELGGVWGIWRGDTASDNVIWHAVRELTDQYRGLATRLETSDGSAELSRIQNTISMTDEDLRQLSSRNAQAGRLQQKMGGR